MIGAPPEMAFVLWVIQCHRDHPRIDSDALAFLDVRREPMKAKGYSTIAGLEKLTPEEIKQRNLETYGWLSSNNPFIQHLFSNVYRVNARLLVFVEIEA